MKGKVGTLYEELINRNQHILIAGTTGSGKSVLLNGIINSILYRSVNEHQMVLIDVKRVEFNKYRNTTHCIKVATSSMEAKIALRQVRDLIKKRLANMDERGLDMWDGTIIHLIVDEMAELVLNDKEIPNLLQSICQIGRAAGIQVICATQCPLASVIPTRIKVNFPVLIGLHVVSKQHSRNILEVSGCEELPMYGEALIQYPSIGIKREFIPMIPKELITAIIEERQKEVIA